MHYGFFGHKHSNRATLFRKRIKVLWVSKLTLASCLLLCHQRNGSPTYFSPGLVYQLESGSRPFASLPTSLIFSSSSRSGVVPISRYFRNQWQIWGLGKKKQNRHQLTGTQCQVEWLKRYEMAMQSDYKDIAPEDLGLSSLLEVWLSPSASSCLHCLSAILCWAVGIQSVY